MKKIIVLGIVVALVSCVNDNEFDTPEVGPVVCTENIIIEKETPFLEDFENDISSWVQVVEASERYWEVDEQQGNTFVNLSAFRSNNLPVSLKTWLISPQVDFDQMQEKVVSFKLADAFQNGNPLHVYISTNYDGKNCPMNYTWVEVGQEKINNIINNSGVYDNKFESSGQTTSR